MAEVPTHQEAPPRSRRKIAAAPNAAGLKIWRRNGAIRYLDAIAMMPASAKIPAPFKSIAGVKIKNKIKAEMKQDSVLTGAPNNLAKM